MSKHGLVRARRPPLLQNTIHETQPNRQSFLADNDLILTNQRHKANCGDFSKILDKRS